MKPAGFSRVVWARRLNALACDLVLAKLRHGREAVAEAAAQRNSTLDVEDAHELDMAELACDGRYTVLVPDVDLVTGAKAGTR